MKYLIACPVYGPPLVDLKRNMSFLASSIGRDPIYHSMEPHLTLHRPVTNLSLDQLKEVVVKLASEMNPIEVRTGRSQLFGSELLVLSIQGLNLRLANLWVHLHDQIFELTGERGEYDGENTLHITLLNKLSKLEEETREFLVDVVISPIVIPLDRIAIYERTSDGPLKWDQIWETKFG